MRQTAMRAKLPSARPVALPAPPMLGTPPLISYNLGRRTPAVPGNLTIGRLDDPSEKAADRVADTVMGRSQPAAATAAAQTGSAAPLPGPIRPTSSAPPELGLGPGRPMPAAVRGFFEPRFGKDLSAVRIHTDAAAGRSAEALGARAYSIGSNVVFGGGEYHPESESGKHLIAHELAHAAQAGTGTGNNQVVRRQPAPDQVTLVIIENEIRMLRAMPVLHPVYRHRLVQLESQRAKMVAGNGAAARSPYAEPSDRLIAAKLLLKKSEKGREVIDWLKGFRKHPSALSASIQASEISIFLSVEKGISPYYDKQKRRLVLNSDQTAQQMVLSIIYLGPQTNDDPDPLRHSRENFASVGISDVEIGLIDQIEFKKELAKSGTQIAASVPFEQDYSLAHSITFDRELPKDASRTWRDIGPDAASKAASAGRDAVRAAIMADKPIPGGTRSRAIERLGAEWDQAKAARDTKDAENAERNRIEVEKRAKINADIDALAADANRFSGNDADCVGLSKRIVNIIFPLNSVDQGEFIKKAEAGLKRLFGPFGFKILNTYSGSPLQLSRLSYGIAEFLKMTKGERDYIRRDPLASVRYQIQLNLTDAEHDAESATERRTESQIIATELSDGSFYQGPRGNVHRAEQQIQINHDLAQLYQISNAGPLSLIGRMIGGEKGAMIGAMADVALPIASARQARRNTAAYQSSGGHSLTQASPTVSSLRTILPAQTPARPLAFPRTDLVNGAFPNEPAPRPTKPIPPPASKPGGSMRRPPGRGSRAGMAATEKTLVPFKRSNPKVEVLPRKSEPLTNFEPMAKILGVKPEQLVRGIRTEAEVAEAFNLGPKNTAKFQNPQAAEKDFIPDHVAGNPQIIQWGNPYHMTEIKDWKKMGDTGNLSAMIDYLSVSPQSSLKIYFRSDTYISQNLVDRINKYRETGQIILIPFISQ